MNRTSDTDVLIVGAGPVGLFLANECARRSMSYRIVEKNAGQSNHSKALAVMPRTLEIFDMAGVVEPFLQRANRTTCVALFADRHRLAQLAFAPKESAYPFIAMIPQNVTEALLLEALQSKGGAVEYGTTFVSLAQREDGVLAELERGGNHFSINARFVVGCDGAHSAVRKVLNLPFEGGDYDATFLLADLETNDALSGDEMQLCSHEDGPLAIFPMSNTRRRIVATIHSADGEAPSLNLVKALLADRAPEGIEAHELHWSSYFRVHHRHVAKAQSARVFLAGDAAHIHSPFGGQGMNTGLHDAWNLAWKLAFAVRGYATCDLLDSYSGERGPVVKRVIATTDLLTKAMGTPSKIAQGIRNTLIPIVAHFPLFQGTFVEQLSQLGVAYAGSRIVEGRGHRYFDEWMRDGGIRNQFVLLIGSDASEACVEKGINIAATFREALEVRVSQRTGVALIRPDGYTAFSSYRSDADALCRVQRVLQRQVSATASNAEHVREAAYG